ncbi:MAG: hypothetical protein KHZ58_06760 [Hungatella hathewayi]|nr:hypothetical protein [Hungatella hathewayi]
MDLLRTEEELKQQIGELARVYTPEWEFSEENPDAGSVIALIFAEQMGKRLEVMDGVLERYRFSLANMLGLTLRPAVPAEGVIAMEVVRGVDDSVPVPAGSKFLASGNDERLIVFETKEVLSVSPASLTEIVGIEKASGKVIPWKGDWKPVDILGVSLDMGDARQEGIWFQGLLLCFQNFSNRPGETLRLKTGIKELAGDMESYEFQFYTDSGFLKCVPSGVCGDTVEFQQEIPWRELEHEGKAYRAILIRRLYPADRAVIAQGIGLAAAGTVEPAEFRSCGEEELTGERFYPFGERINLYEEFYIGSSSQFGRAGAIITVSFRLSYEERDYAYGGVEENFELKPIRKKPRGEWKQTQYRCAVDAVALEYYNGIGWKSLSCGCDIRNLFNGTAQGELCFTFLCPEDWEDASAGGYEGKLLRFKITRAGDCYMLPCRHKLPVISGLNIRSSYEGIWREPDRVFVYGGAGGAAVEGTNALSSTGRLEAFSPLPWKGDCLYLGFDKKFTDGPVSFFLKLREDSGGTGLEPVYSYSTRNGFKQLEFIDNTERLTSSGTVLFMPPDDMAAVEVAGKTAFWLRIEDGRERYPAGGLYPFVIEDIIWNAVAVRNIETRTEEDYYLDTPGADMEFALGNGSILRAEVFVNERDVLSPASMKKLLDDCPEDVRVEYDSLGEIREFFVRWKEIDDFCHSKAEDRHYVIDRVNHLLKFGNGIHGKIPGVKNGTAFTVSVLGCDGEEGNVPAGAVTSSSSNLMFLEDIRNPVGMRGGSNMEDLEHACKRGTAVLNGRGRLVSRQDYIREVLGYSNHIDKAACIIESGPVSRISIVLLMKDYRQGSGSFYQLQRELKRWLQGRCEIGAAEDSLVIREPIFVKINTEIWVELWCTESAFEIQERIQTAVEQFLEPVATGTRNGWEIGVLPQEGQILRMLQSLHFDGKLLHLLVSAQYPGEGEKELSAVRENPFVIGINGTHRIHVSLPGGKGGRR